MDWVWYSTEESRENRQISILAIIEVVLAVAIYWGIALYYDFYGHIWASVAVAPFLLFKNSRADEFALSCIISLKEFYIYYLALA